MSRSTPPEPREVLIVDDEEDLGFSLALSLELAGYQVRTAFTGQDALSLVDDHEPDAIVLDLRLPDIDGWDLLGRLRTAGRFPRIPVVVVSASVDPATTARAADLGCRACLVKPFSAAELKRAVQAALPGTVG